MASIQTYDFTSKRTGKSEKRYRAFYRDAANHQVAKVFKTKRDATAWLDQRTHERVTGQLADRRAGRITFRAWWDEALHREYAEATVRLRSSVWRHLEPLADVRLGDITPAMVNRIVGRVKAPAMRDKTREVLRAVLNAAVADGRLSVNPAATIRRTATRAERKRRQSDAETRVRRLNYEQLAALVDQIPERWQGMVRLMMHVGLRPGEAYALRVGKVDLLKRTILIDTAASGDTKTGESRRIPIPAVVADLLRDHIARFSDASDPEALVFPNNVGKMTEGRAFRRSFALAAKKAGVNNGGLSPNDLRHTAVAFAVANGASVYDVQQMVGHARPSITLDVYGFLWDSSLERLAEKLDGAIRQSWKEAHSEGTVVSLR